MVTLVVVTAYLDEDALARVLPHWPSPEQLADTVFDGVLTCGGGGRRDDAYVAYAVMLAARASAAAPTTPASSPSSDTVKVSSGLGRSIHCFAAM